MIVEFTKYVDAMSRATDYIEAELLHVPQYHEKRVAILVCRMGTQLGLDTETVYALTIAGAMHDCALSEYLQDEVSEHGGRKEENAMAAHCLAGEMVMEKYPVYERMSGAVLYHHETADGNGAYGLPAEKTPLGARLIHIADVVDNRYGLNTMDPDKHADMLDWVKGQEGSLFDGEVIRAFLATANYEALLSITGDRVVRLLDVILPPKPVDIPIAIVRDISEFFAYTTDFKSHFTWKHSLGIAEKAEMLGRYYGYPEEQCQKLYIAGALHDIGKLLIRNDILEKPGKLTPEEYRQIQNHAVGTWDLLHNIGGMEDIARWASLHHEKLDGSGYPFGYGADELSKEERMLACMDIYQALVEERPYKAGLPHPEAMAIMERMGAAGQLDRGIIADIRRCFDTHTPQPVSEAPEIAAAPKHKGESWRCPVCGYVVEGALPKDLICPQCEQPGSIFERI